MALDKYNGFVAGDTLPAENANSIDPANLEGEDDADRLVRVGATGKVPEGVLQMTDAQAAKLLDGSNNVSEHYHLVKTIASDVLKQSADTQRGPFSGGPIKHKEIQLFGYKGGMIRVKIDGINNTHPSSSGAVQIYLNGASVVSQSLTASWATYSFDITITDVNPVLLSVYTTGSSSPGSQIYIRNFRVYYDEVAQAKSVVILD